MTNARSVASFITGDWRHREFEPAVAWLSGATRLTVCDDLEAARSAVAHCSSAPLIVVAQSRPGQWSAAKVAQLAHASPLASVVALLGSWCEGEMRGDRIWAGATAVGWQHWNARLKREVAALASRPGERLPQTAGQSERLFYQINEVGARRSLNGLAQNGVVGIFAERLVDRDMLQRACQSLGWEVAAVSLEETGWVCALDLLLTDTLRWDTAVIERLHSLAARIAPTPVLALASFPRLDDCRLLADAGVTVCSKPFFLADLGDCIEQLVSARQV